MHSPTIHGWTEISGYDLHTRDGADSVTGITRPGDRIFRGPVIENEGYFDISEYTAEQLALGLGWCPPSQVEYLAQEVKILEEKLADALSAQADLRERVRALTLDNAELYDALGPGDEGDAP